MTRRRDVLRPVVVLVGAAVLLVLTSAPAGAEARDKNDFTVTGRTTCADADGRWKVTWTVTNTTAKPAFVTAAEAVPPNARERYAGQTAAGGAELEGIFEGAAAPKAGDPQLTGTLVLGPDEPAAQVDVTLRWDEPEQVYDVGRRSDVVDKPAPCESTPAPSAGAAESAGLRPVATSTCTDLSISLRTPIDAEISAAEFTPSNGPKQTVDLSPGYATTVKFAAAEGLSVGVSLIGGQGWSETLPWQRPAHCAAAEPRVAGVLSPRNPAPVAIAAGGGALVLVVGGAWLFTRRRRHG